eukprot:g2519.t1
MAARSGPTMPPAPGGGMVSEAMMPWWLKQGSEFAREANSMSQKLVKVPLDSPQRCSGRSNSPTMFISLFAGDDYTSAGPAPSPCPSSSHAGSSRDPSYGSEDGAVPARRLPPRHPDADAYDEDGEEDEATDEEEEEEARQALIAAGGYQPAHMPRGRPPPLPPHGGAFAADRNVLV